MKKQQNQVSGEILKAGVHRQDIWASSFISTNLFLRELSFFSSRSIRYDWCLSFLQCEIHFSLSVFKQSVMQTLPSCFARECYILLLEKGLKRV